MLKFPSINQYRNAVKHVQTNTRYAGRDENDDPVYDHTIPLPTLTFRGTVKLHGTNAGIVFDMDTGEIQYQSRERVLTLEQDNAGFMLYMKQYEAHIHDIAYQVYEILGLGAPVSKVCIYGEWCGQGIQKGVAVSELPKMFVIFAVRVVYKDETSHWMPIGEFDVHYPEQRIFNIDTFPTYSVAIDFATPELSQNKMIEITEAVEAECPVGAYFGVKGIGEGVVWAQDVRFPETSGDWFKVKGEKHSVTKVKKLSSVDVEAIQALNDFVESVVTEARLEWALDNMLREKLLPLEMSSMGDFIRLVYGDVMKEEMDTIIENQLDPKKLGGPIANKSRPWFIKKFNESINL